MVRKMISKSNPTVEITMNDDQVKVRILTMMVAREETFTVGTPYEQKQPDGHVSLVRNFHDCCQQGFMKKWQIFCIG